MRKTPLKNLIISMTSYPNLTFWGVSKSELQGFSGSDLTFFCYSLQSGQNGLESRGKIYTFVRCAKKQQFLGTITLLFGRFNN